MNESIFQESFQKLLFCHQKKNKNADSPIPSIQVCRGVYISYFKISTPIFSALFPFQRISQPSDQDQQNGAQTCCRLPL